MSNWKTVASGKLIDINEYLDFRQYNTLVERDAASISFGLTEMFHICRVVETGNYYYWNGVSWIEWAEVALGTYSYLVYKSDSTYYSIDENGTVLSAGANANTVVQATLNALTTGGTVFIRQNVEITWSQIAFPAGIVRVIQENQSPCLIPYPFKDGV